MLAGCPASIVDAVPIVVPGAGLPALSVQELEAAHEVQATPQLTKPMRRASILEPSSTDPLLEGYDRLRSAGNVRPDVPVLHSHPSLG